jgi:hypothetical protein
MMWGFFYVIFARDFMEVVKEANSNPPYFSRIGHFIDSIKQELNLLRSSSFIYTDRESNSAVHVVAREVGFNYVDSVWLEDISRSINVSVTRELVVRRS